MAAKHLLLAAVALLSVSCAVGGGYGGLGFPSFGGCNAWELGYLSNTCLMPFRYAHTGLLGGSACMSSRLQCSVASSCWSCINRIPRNFLSSGCWGGISTAVTSIFRSYNIGCSFQQVQNTCAATLPTLAIPAVTGVGWPGIGIGGAWPGYGMSGLWSGMGMGMGMGGCQPGIAGCAPAIGSCMGGIC